MVLSQRLRLLAIIEAQDYISIYHAYFPSSQSDITPQSYKPIDPVPLALHTVYSPCVKLCTWAAAAVVRFMISSLKYELNPQLFQPKFIKNLVKRNIGSMLSVTDYHYHLKNILDLKI